VLTDQQVANLVKKISGEFAKAHPELQTTFGNDQLATMMLAHQRNYSIIAAQFTIKALDEYGLIAYKEISIEKKGG